MFKPLNKKETKFYIFETSITSFSVFESKLGFPLYSGNWGITNNVIKTIKKTIKNPVISYYTINKDGTLHYEHFWSTRHK